ncbi:polysaccharide pyruvyl transferase family protein [Oceanobacillus jeddahense]|uniref:polysaccharide pyruvyl transferase family protein n=1 Tax=Oceanobacillus jeddahense TaxID=1462527 RepID=UPI000595E5E6|nr:polysaccharide pyruvyl transferase family protein [Oceanobacillus jeddahense]
MNKTILYIGWIGYRNLGDDLLWNLFRDRAGKYFGSGQITIVPSLPGVNIQHLERYDIIVLGGGSLIAPTYIQLLYRAIKMKKKVCIWGSGIDRIPEAALYAMQEGEKVPAIQRFKGEEIAQLREVFLQADFVGVRGPYTKKVLETLTGVSDVPVIGDPGLLLESNQAAVQKEKCIGINWGTTMNNLYGNKEKDIERQLAEAAKQWISEGYKVFIYAVWSEDFPACQRLYKLIDKPEKVLFEKKLYTEQELMKKLSICSLTINFKLHPNLLSLSAGVPAVALGYRFKVFDLFASLGLDHLVLSTSEEQINKRLIKLADATMQEADKIRKEYREKQQIYGAQIEKIFTEDGL